jgi:hypothetical protein
VPKAGDNVDIPQGQVVELDVTPPVLGYLSINGTLRFKDVNINLTAKNIMVHGRFEIGTEANPFMSKAVITLTDTDVDRNDMNMGTRGLMVMGGTLELHGNVTGPSWTKIAATANAGATQLALINGTGWKAGDDIAIAPTDYYVIGRTERHAISAMNGNQLTLVSPLAKTRWGALQYISAQGVTLTPPSGIAVDAILDERAEVANLTRNIVIQGADDTVWQNNGFGAHMMSMSGAVTHIDGVEFRRVGQAGKLGRYPVHFHRLSYATDGSVLNDVSGQYVRDSSIWNSSQRCITIHATNGLLVENNVCYDIKAHAIFLEDAVERRNIIRNNLVLHVNSPKQTDALLKHDLPDFRGGVTGYWIANPDNTIEDNVAADSEGSGFWYSFPSQGWGNSTNVNIYPNRLKPKSLKGSVAHSNQVGGMLLDEMQVDALGETNGNKYCPTSDEKPTGTCIPFKLEKFVSYKHFSASGSNAFWNSVILGTFDGFLIADFSGLGFAGPSVSCLITNSTVVGSSFNDANRPADQQDIVGVASYHSQCDITGNTFVNLRLDGVHQRGAFSTADYYIRPVEKGMSRNEGNRLINTDPGLRAPSPNVIGTDNWAYAGAIWDPFGYWGAQNNYWTYDLPYFTAGQSNCTAVVPAGNGMSCPGPYYGMLSPVFDGVEDMDQPLDYIRMDSGGPYYWSIGDGALAKILRGMRHGAALKGGEYIVRSPTKAPKATSIRIDNLLSATDSFIIGLPYHASTEPGAVNVTSMSSMADVAPSYQDWRAGNPNWKSSFRGEYWYPITKTDSLQKVRDSNGSLYYWDQAQNLVWIKAVGACAVGCLFKGVYHSELPATDEINLYLPLAYTVSELP